MKCGKELPKILMWRSVVQAQDVVAIDSHRVQNFFLSAFIQRIVLPQIGQVDDSWNPGTAWKGMDELVSNELSRHDRKRVRQPPLMLLPRVLTFGRVTNKATRKMQVVEIMRNEKSGAIKNRTINPVRPRK